MNTEAKELKARTAEEIYDFIEGVQAHKHDYEFKKSCIINTLHAWKREISTELRVGQPVADTESGLHLADVTNSLPDLTLDGADVLVKETDYACYACEDTEEINWGDAAAFFIEGYQHAIRKFRQ